ncbi:MAG: glycosyltransferase [Acetobacteraceae bacterium]
MPELPRIASAPADPERTQAAAALAAWTEGEAAEAAGDEAGALRWFDRAHRLAPKQDRIALSLAMALMRAEDPGAIALLAGVAERHDLRSVWLALAAAHRRAGDSVAAARAAERALSGHAWTRQEALRAEMLGRVAIAAGRPGWCALAGDGALLIGRQRLESLALSLDGRPVAAGDRPRGWERAGALVVMAEGSQLLGSPIRIAAIRRTEGLVAWRDGELQGWVWHPGEPLRVPVLGIGRAGASRPTFTIRATEEGIRLAEAPPLARPRGFVVPAARLGGIAGMVSVRDRDGRDLAGSPLDFRLEAAGAAALTKAVAVLLPAARRPRRARPDVAAIKVASVPADLRAPARDRRRGDRRRCATGLVNPVDIVIPVHGAAPVVLASLRSVQRSLAPGSRVIVVDDASPEPALARELARMAEDGKIRLIQHRQGRGFPAACNAGIRAARQRSDIVLLNSDILVAPLWIEGLQAAALAADDIGTATPFSNDATILSYPDPGKQHPAPDQAGTERLARRVARLYRGRAVEIPTGVGFCLYLRRPCLEEVGLFREDRFAQGYGEENDFCMRARHLGWRHVAAPGVFVSHLGGRSFGAVGPELRQRNLRILNRLHPGYDELIARHRLADPLFPYRRRLDATFFADGRCRGSVLMITHARGGGVDRLLAARAAAVRHQGYRPILLVPAAVGPEARAILVQEAGGCAFPNLRFAIPAERASLARLIRRERPDHCEVHHLVGHDHAILELCRELGIPYDIWLHDYASFCARIALIGPERRYCGEPQLPVCAACVADAGSELEEEITPAALVRRSDFELRGARQVIAPSADVALRVRRHFPELPISVAPWEDDATVGAPIGRRFGRRFGRPRTVVVIGAIGTAKGYEVLLAVARDAASRELAIRFVLIGYSRDDRRLLDTGRVFVSGQYDERELPGLIARERGDFAFLPSVWPETWCFTLSEAWRAGLDVAAFDLGTQAARIRATGRGWLLPLGLSPPAINNALLALNPLAPG